MSPQQSVIVSVSDICIEASYADSQIYAEPGVALLAPGETPILGKEAQKALRQQPTRINSRYWLDLSTDALQINNSSVRHNADLAWHQLSQIKSQLDSKADLSPDNPISLCVPSNLNQQQLQLLTGICQSLELRVGSLVNMGLAQLVGNLGLAIKEQQNITHIDLQLHQLVLTSYRSVGSKMEPSGQEIIQDISFLRLLDRLLHLLRDKFIQSSRFDPLHSGDTEQQLFNQLIKMIETGTQKPFQVDSAQKQHSIELSAQELNAVITEFKSELASRIPSSEKYAYAPIFKQLPGFQFTENDIGLVRTDTATGVGLLIPQQAQSEDIIYIKQALLNTEAATEHSSPASTSSDSVSNSNDINQPKAANALVFQNQVYQQNSYASLIQAGLPEGLLEFKSEHLVVVSNQLTVNDAKASAGQILSVGDHIAVNGMDSLLAVRLAD